MFSGSHHYVEKDADGNLHVYRKRARTTDDKVGEGIADLRPSKLIDKLPPDERERIHKLRTQADINKANAEFWARKSE